MILKAHSFSKKVLFFSLGLIMCFFSGSCGLDVYYILYPPSESRYVDQDTDALGRYFSFRTADQENSEMDIFIGTTVIYKIYNTLSKLLSDSSSISIYNDEFSEKGYNRAIALGYQQMLTSNSDYPLVSKSNNNKTVEIRLFTEGFGENPYEAGIKISDQYTMDGSDKAIPLRSENARTFAFYSSEKNTIVNDVSYSNEVPTQEDIDVSFVELEESSQENVWYVNAYAVSVGMTSDFTYKYSELEPLGFIVIKESDFTN